jgi:UDP-N-acetylmuramoylalanine--D-glutamate ligase
MVEYAAAKAQIFVNQKPDDWLVLNADQKSARSFAARAPGQVMWFSRTQRVEGLFLLDDEIVHQSGSQTTAIASRNDVRLLGDHNIENVLAAVALALLAGVTPPQLRAALQAFKPVPHRLELVRELNGVRYVNDTTSTAPAATIAALKAIGDNIILIVGGSDKGLDFEALGRSASLRAKWILTLEGEAYDRLDGMIRYGGGGPKIAGKFHSLADAVNKAHELAQPGDTVLLSPACASFGMFKNEFERGDQFRAIVNGL